MKKIFLLVAVVGLLIGCKSKQVVLTLPTEEVLPIATVDTSAIPSFVAEALYVIAREYESIHNPAKPKYHTAKAEEIRNSATITKADYLEQRLIELYPQTAYKGVVQKIVHLAEKIFPERKPKQFDYKTLEFGIATSDTKAKSISSTFVSDSTEMELLSMTPTERVIYQTLNQMADDTTFVTANNLLPLTIKDEAWHLEKKIFSDSLSFFIKENLTLPILVFGPGSYLFYRIMQSKARAFYAEEFYFPGKQLSGSRSDAYKHILVNTLLKRYTSAPLAWLVMDIYWERIGHNAPCDRIMDLHNNIIGRSTKYTQFVNNGNGWEQWAKNIYHFVQDTTQNAVHKAWTLDTPSILVIQDEQATPDFNYLYWKK